MKIVNDKISLDPGDIAQFSPAAQKALAFPEFGRESGGPFGGRTYKEVAETAFNQALQNALEVWRKTVVSGVSKLAEAFETEIDPQKKAQAETLIDQAKAILNVPAEAEVAIDLNPTAQPAVPK